MTTAPASDNPGNKQAGDDEKTMLDAISEWIQADIVAEAAARCDSQTLEDGQREERLRALSAQWQVQLRAAMRLIAMAAVRVESRRVALRWMADQAGANYERADALARAAVEEQRQDANAIAGRLVWARTTLAQMAHWPTDQETGSETASQAQAGDLLDEEIRGALAEQENKRKERWAQLGPTAVAAREALAIEQLAVGAVVVAGHREALLADLLAVGDGFQHAAMRLADEHGLGMEFRAKHAIEAAQHTQTLMGQPRYRRQLVGWAGVVAQDMDAPAPVELRSVAPRAGGSTPCPMGRR